MKILIEGKPMGKGRPRFTMATKRAYTPEATANYETLIKLAYQQQSNGLTFPIDCELEVNIVAYFPTPRSASKKKKAAMLSGEINPTSKPDVDNISKIILDSLNGIAYRDDSQVTDLKIQKKYAEYGRVELEIIQRGRQDGI